MSINDRDPPPDPNDEATDDAATTPRVPPPSPAPVTKPSRERLRETRHEPTWQDELAGNAPTRLTPPAPMPSGIGSVPPPPPGSERSVLIVDDEADLRESLRMALEDDGYIVETAENGVEGLRSLGQMLTGNGARGPGACDVVILDLEMPKLTGFDVLAIVQAWSCLDWLPVIILSGKPRPVDQDLPEEFVFLRKGDDPRALLATVRKFADISRARRRP